MLKISKIRKTLNAEEKSIGESLITSCYHNCYHIQNFVTKTSAIKLGGYTSYTRFNRPFPSENALTKTGILQFYLFRLFFFTMDFVVIQ